MCEQAIQIAVLGDRAVGKSSIIHQWLYNDYSTDHFTTRQASYYFSSLFNGQRLFHIRIIDTPCFDENNHHDPQQEWIRLYCFRRAHLFLLIFDINREESFNYIKQIYRQIVRLRSNNATTSLNHSNLDETHAEVHLDTIPVIVVANKIDLICNDMKISNHVLQQQREIQQNVKKFFQANAILCSAKYHWHLVVLFKEVCHVLETFEDSAAKQAAQQARRRQNQGKHCLVM